jgi:hypothetical protein
MNVVFVLFRLPGRAGKRLCIERDRGWTVIVAFVDSTRAVRNG